MKEVLITLCVIMTILLLLLDTIIRHLMIKEMGILIKELKYQKSLIDFHASIIDDVMTEVATIQEKLNQNNIMLDE